MFTWDFDALTGVYKSHAMSNKMLEYAALQFVLLPFAKAQEGFGKHSGESVSLPYYKPGVEPTSPELDENMRVPIDNLEMDGRIITVKEWGRGVSYTSLAQDLSKFDPDNGAQKVLQDQFKLCLDTGVANAMKELKVCFTPTAAGAATIDTDGAHSTPALVNLDLAHLGLIRDYMASDLHVPFYKGDHYVGAFSTKALRGLKNDNSLTQWNQYLGKGSMLYKSEVGMAETIRFVEVAHENAFSNSVGTGNCTGEGVVFGDDAVRMVEVEAPQLRANPNYKGDFGRRKAVIWYGIIAFGTPFLSADDRLARGVRWGSG